MNRKNVADPLDQHPVGLATPEGTGCSPQFVQTSNQPDSDERRRARG